MVSSMSVFRVRVLGKPTDLRAATFGHFLTDEADQAAYARLAAQTVKDFGHLVVAAFAPTGPARRSGLLVHRYDGSSLAKLFADSFDLVEVTGAKHSTLSGGEQIFTRTVFRCRSSELRLPR